MRWRIVFRKTGLFSDKSEQTVMINAKDFREAADRAPIGIQLATGVNIYDVEIISLSLDD